MNIDMIINNLITTGSIGAVFLTLAKVNDRFNPFNPIIKKLDKFNDVLEDSLDDIYDQLKQSDIENQVSHEEMKQTLKEHRIELLRLTLCSTEIPLTERLKAGDMYVKLGGNGEAKVIYKKLQEKFGDTIEKDNKIL